jgi:hypothetical protein
LMIWSLLNKMDKLREIGSRLCNGKALANQKSKDFC